MMKKVHHRMMLLLPAVAVLAIALSSCGGSIGTEAGNPTDVPARTIRGTVSAVGGEKGYYASINCAADEVVANFAKILPEGHPVADDCSFAFEVFVGSRYAIDFSRLGAYVASMEFHDKVGESTDVYVVPAGEDDIDLGLIEISSGVATPEYEPPAQDEDDGAEEDLEDEEGEERENEGSMDAIDDQMKADVAVMTRKEFKAYLKMIEKDWIGEKEAFEALKHALNRYFEQLEKQRREGDDPPSGDD